jgi:hypothetical protein
MESNMDTEKKPAEPEAEQPKQNVGDLVGELVVSGATMLANTAAKAVVSRVKKAAAKSGPAKAATTVVRTAKKSIAAKSRKAKTGTKASKKTKQKLAKKSAKKRSARKSKRKRK